MADRSNGGAANLGGEPASWRACPGADKPARRRARRQDCRPHVTLPNASAAYSSQHMCQQEWWRAWEHAAGSRGHDSVSLLSAADLEPIARRQLADYDAHRPGTIFSDPEFRLTLPEAYQVQMLLASLRESRGESIAGYKVGCVSESVQKQLGIAEPGFGRLFPREIHRSGVSLDAAHFDHLAIAGEFALRTAEDAAS